LGVEIRQMGWCKSRTSSEYLNLLFFCRRCRWAPKKSYTQFPAGFAAQRYTFPSARGTAHPGRRGQVPFLRQLVQPTTYSGLCWTTIPPLAGFPVAMLFYYLYLYLNFSGFLRRGHRPRRQSRPAVRKISKSVSAQCEDFWNPGTSRFPVGCGRSVLSSQNSSSANRPPTRGPCDCAHHHDRFLLGASGMGGLEFRRFGGDTPLGVVTNHY